MAILRSNLGYKLVRIDLLRVYTFLDYITDRGRKTEMVFLQHYVSPETKYVEYYSRCSVCKEEHLLGTVFWSLIMAKEVPVELFVAEDNIIPLEIFHDSLNEEEIP